MYLKVENGSWCLVPVWAETAPGQVVVPHSSKLKVQPAGHWTEPESGHLGEPTAKTFNTICAKGVYSVYSANGVSMSTLSVCCTLPDPTYT